MSSESVASSLKYKDIRMGAKFSFRRFISQEDVYSFARLTGDFNPLHLDDNFARDNGFKSPIIHGMLASSLFSTLAGMRCPGKYSLILSQEINYIKPVMPDSDVVVRGKVVGKVDSINVLVIECSILNEAGKVLIEGTMKVKVMR